MEQPSVDDPTSMEEASEGILSENNAVQTQQLLFNESLGLTAVPEGKQMPVISEELDSQSIPLSESDAAEVTEDAQALGSSVPVYEQAPQGDDFPVQNMDQGEPFSENVKEEQFGQGEETEQSPEDSTQYSVTPMETNEEKNDGNPNEDGEGNQYVLNPGTGDFESVDSKTFTEGHSSTQVDAFVPVSQSEGQYFAVVQEGPDGQVFVQQEEKSDIPGVIYAGILPDGSGSLYIEGAGNVQMDQGSIISVAQPTVQTAQGTSGVTPHLTGVITSERLYGEAAKIACSEFYTNPGGAMDGYDEEAEDYPEESEGEFVEDVKPKKKRHVCGRCGQHFDTWLRMCEHRKKHGREKRLGFQCKKCGEHFRLKVSLAEHSCSRMRRRKCCPCPRCGVLFFKKEFLLWHMWHHPKEKKFSMQIKQDEEDRYRVSECGECGARFKHRTSLTKHMMLHAGKQTFECEECGTAFTRQGHFRRHLLMHKGEEKHPCVECGANFRSMDALTKHMKKHDDGINVMCEECGQIFEKPSDLREHKKEHLGMPKFSCGLCGYDYSFFASYKKHLQQHESTEYQCPDCGIMVSLEIDYEDHCDTHGGSMERSYICELCGATFGESFKLKQHLTMHETKSGYECLHCQATYRYFASFRKHMLMHGVQQYLCPNCAELVNLEDETASHLCRGEAEGAQIMGELSVQDEVEMITGSNEMEAIGEGVMNADGTVNMQNVVSSESHVLVDQETDGNDNAAVVQDFSDATIVEAMQDPTTGQLMTADGTILQNMQFTMEGLEGATAMVDENNTVVLVIADGNFNMEDLAQVTEGQEQHHQE